MVDLDKPLKLQERTTIRKGLNDLRSEGLVPAVVHNHGQPSVHVMAPEMELERIFEVAGKHHPLNLEVGDQKFLALIKDAHFNPVKRKLQHVVFQAIRRDEKVEAEVPIHLEGEIPAEKVGLQVLHHLDHVEIEALPANLPDSIVVDATVLAEIGDKINVGDLKLPEGVTLLTEPEQSIAAVIEPKEQVIEEPEAEVAEGEEGVEGESAAAEGEGESGTAPDVSEAQAAGEQTPKE
ncbi:MAG TPA: 50S ribosomal protein L25 [Candidatus Saccharimonadales bacterium]|nr:50S ribosomal protein L25 [Candidatus Saccharimonadales bacterium]